MKHRFARVAASLAFLAALAPARSASANAPAPLVRRPPDLGGAFVLRHTVLAVEHEDLSFRCDDDGCRFEATYHVVNPGDQPEEVLGAFYGGTDGELTILADGKDARHALTPEQVAQIDRAVAEIDPAAMSTVPAGESAASGGRPGFTLAVQPHARATLVFAGRLRSMSFEPSAPYDEFVLPALETRHLLLATEARREAVDPYAYALSPIRSWAGSPDIDVTVRFPANRSWYCDQGSWVVSDDGGGRVARAKLASRDASVLRFELRRPGTTVRNGGPLFGFGGQLGAPELRLKAGYEVGYSDWLLASASVEANLHGRTTLVPLVEVATPDIIIMIPSLGLGVGVPVQLRTGEPTLVGARAQLTVSVPFLSLVVPFDWFPGASGSDTAQISMLAEVSF